MKILHITSSMNPSTGGVCQAILTYTNALKPLNVQSEVVSFDPPGASYLTSIELPIHRLEPGKYGWGYNPKLDDWLYQYGTDFDAWLVHGLWLYHGFAAYRSWRAIDGKRPRLFVFPHGMLDPWFQSWRRRPVKTLRNIAYWHTIETRLIHSADALLFTCEQERSLAASTFYGYCPKATAVVGLGNEDPLGNGGRWTVDGGRKAEGGGQKAVDGGRKAEGWRKKAEQLGVDPERVRPWAEAFYGRFPELINRPFILLLSRIHQKKGVDLLLAAASKHALPNFPALVIAGPCSDEAYWDQLQSFAFKSGLQSAPLPFSHLTLSNTDSAEHGSTFIPHPSSFPLIWPGMLQGDLKWGALFCADAFVLPSHQENFGIAVVEALACGTPVLISDQVNISNEIAEEGAGIVASDTVEGTVRILQQYITLSPLEKTRMSQKARHCFVEKFSSEKTANTLFRVLSSLA